MSSESIVQHSAGSTFVALHQDYLILCDGNLDAAILLSIFEGWLNYKFNKLGKPNPITEEELYVYRTYEQLKVDSMGLLSASRDKISQALKLLVRKEFISIVKNPNNPLDRRNYYIIRLNYLNELLSKTQIQAKHGKDKCRKAGNVIPYPSIVHDRTSDSPFEDYDSPVENSENVSTGLSRESNRTMEREKSDCVNNIFNNNTLNNNISKTSETKTSTPASVAVLGSSERSNNSERGNKSERTSLIDSVRQELNDDERALLDAFMKATDYQMRPSRKYIKQWVGTFQEWNAECVKPEHVEAGVRFALSIRKEDGTGLNLPYPSSFTQKIIMAVVAPKVVEGKNFSSQYHHPLHESALIE